MRTCTVDKCTKPHVAKGFCRLHYGRNRKHGDPGTAELLRDPNRTCSEEGCDKPHKGRGYCNAHLKRLTIHGDTSTNLTPSRGTNNLTYSGSHGRVRLTRGRAAEYDCVDCGGPADEWSYNHQDPNELFAVVTNNKGYEYEVAYSSIPDYYDPRCKACHVAYDRLTTEHPTTQEVTQ